eukprot:CAMPEP_0177401612 /NCGR_PEP_ID=MMETSP0368-20130122/59741_1 /TAXON_ID=447022 ORGANISM="Scrippsiella hangoei-like, Strain SHHI-4" /NCGR_SAMPLE_ID=MMETSP0368 /ASSEMBLY_ACC=CAM_ASM_000363 /LENGTH=100 /DNA_ID=CAMNT_0018869201 /DNA_START=201 /DNA_END=501 /DNA_ORIENTATION=-
MPDPSAAVFPRQPAELIQLAAAHFAGLFNGKLFVAHARESRQRTTPGTSMDALDLDYGLATGALVGPMSAEGPAPGGLVEGLDGTGPRDALDIMQETAGK